MPRQCIANAPLPGSKKNSAPVVIPESGGVLIVYVSAAGFLAFKSGKTGSRSLFRGVSVVEAFPWGVVGVKQLMSQEGVGLAEEFLVKLNDLGIVVRLTEHHALVL